MPQNVERKAQQVSRAVGINAVWNPWVWRVFIFPIVAPGWWCERNRTRKTQAFILVLWPMTNESWEIPLCFLR